MSVEEAVQAVLRLNPHPGCYAKARWIPTKGAWEFPMIKSPLTADIAEKHVRGEVLLGAVASDEDGHTTSVGLDLDAHLSDQKPAAAARRFSQVASALDVPVVVHTSKSGKGAHIRTLFSQRVPTYMARALYLAIVISTGLSADTAVDKVWPPTHGLGVLALPYNGKMAKAFGGSLAIDPWTLRPLAKRDQLTGVLDGHEMTPDDLERTLVSLQVRTDTEAKMLSGCARRSTFDGVAERILKDQVDGGIQHMVGGCEAVKRLYEEAQGVPYDFWFSMMTNFRPFIGGREIFTELSRLDPARFDQRHLDRTWKAISGGPRKCENLDPMWDCPRRGVCPARAPAGLPFALAKAERPSWQSEA